MALETVPKDLRHLRACLLCSLVKVNREPRERNARASFVLTCSRFLRSVFFLLCLTLPKLRKNASIMTFLCCIPVLELFVYPFTIVSYLITAC